MRHCPLPSVSLSLLAVLVSCSGGSAPVGGVAIPPEFAVQAALPIAGQVRYLNDPLVLLCSSPIDRESVSTATVSVREVDGTGQPIGAAVAGTFVFANDDRELRFLPALPIDGTAAHRGLQPGRSYVLQAIGGGPAVGAVLRGRNGGVQATTFAVPFTTVNGSGPAQWYRDSKPGGPLRSGLAVSTASSLDAVPLGLFGAPPLEVRLQFDQPLDPSPTNVPAGIDVSVLGRNIAQRGSIYLEYADPTDALGTFTWIPAGVELERNAADGATVVLRPVGVMPNHATVRIVVEPSLADLTGQSSNGVVTYDHVFGTFRTQDAWQQQWDGLVEAFGAHAPLDPLAAFAEPPAEVGPGYVKAAFAFDGVETNSDWWPTDVEVVLNTSVATVVPVSGPQREVQGGVFQFRNVTIPTNVTVVGQGPNPLVFLCTGKVLIDGALTARGGAGAQSNGLGQSGASPGGLGQCGGGNGGAGSPDPLVRDLRGAAGRAATGASMNGGNGGYLACLTGCYTGSGYNGSGGGSGGGGGSLAVQGDPHYLSTAPANAQPNVAPTSNTVFQQRAGYGGSGCSGGSGTRSGFLRGGEPGLTVFVDSRSDNDFWGAGVDLHRRLRIAGELAVPVGGGGGGGGGDTSWTPTCSLTSSNPQNDYKAGGGGGGGGVIVIKALDEIWIRSTGSVRADGGHGGGGAQNAASGEAGGGGGGAGGMVVLMSAQAIRIEAHGNLSQNRFAYGPSPGAPFLGNDYSFAISADGGVSTTGGFGSVNITSKYPASGNVPVNGPTYDTDPLGGFGGMGIVQLMTPVGTNADGTNTRLDDNIHFHLPGALSSAVLPPPLGAAAKRQLLAWRGFQDATGTSVDDFGQSTAIGNAEGDIRPAPTLLPAPFGPRSRARSQWIDTGRTDRRPLLAADAGARGVVIVGGTSYGPLYEFAGIDGTTGAVVGSAVRGEGVQLLAPLTIDSVDAGAKFLGTPAYRVRTATPIDATHNRFTCRDAELLAVDGAPLASFRILAHEDRDLWLAPTGTLPTAAVRVRIVARDFLITTNGTPGLPLQVGSGSQPRPTANVRFGFAFHVAPNTSNPLLGRYPSDSVDSFVHDLADPALRQWLTQNQPRFVQWDVLFDLAPVGAPVTLTPGVARPEVRELRLPFRF